MRRQAVNASIKDVAAAAGVSLGTVSNVLNRPDRVSPENRQRVQSAMRDLGFVRNETARQLRAGSSSTVAYVVLDAGNPFFTDVAAGMHAPTDAADLSLFLCNSNHDAARESAYLRRLEQQRVQGVLITPVDSFHPLLDELPARGTPVIIVDRPRKDDTHCSVAVDDVMGGRLAAEHLIGLGHEHIAVVGGPAELRQIQDRVSGARSAVRAAGLPPSALQVVSTPALSIAEGRAAVHRMVAGEVARGATAVICLNDLVALGVLQQCVQSGLRVPDDLAIVGYDDIDFAAAATVPLTSVRQPRRLIGTRAAELVIEEAGSEVHEHQQELFSPELIVRQSSCEQAGLGG